MPIRIHLPIPVATTSTPAAPAAAPALASSRPSAPAASGKRPVIFAKIFRWQPARPEDPQPVAVEIAGTFTGWKKVPLRREKNSAVWQLALRDIPGHHTHSYMLFVDGQPASDKNADGLAIPQTPEEKQHALATARGPRVFMLFSQAK